MKSASVQDSGCLLLRLISRGIDVTRTIPLRLLAYSDPGKPVGLILSDLALDDVDLSKSLECCPLK